MQRVWYAPNRRKKCQSLPEALAWATKNTLGPDKIGRIEPNRSLCPEIPKSETMCSISSIKTNTRPSTKRCLTGSEIEGVTKKQKHDPLHRTGSLPTLGTINSIQPMSASSSSSLTAPAAPHANALGAYQYNPNPHLPVGVGSTTGQSDFLSRNILASQASQAASLMPTAFGHHHSIGLAQDILALRSDQMMATRMAMERELLLGAAIRRSSRPNAHDYPFLGYY